MKPFICLAGTLLLLVAGHALAQIDFTTTFAPLSTTICSAGTFLQTLVLPAIVFVFFMWGLILIFSGGGGRGQLVTALVGGLLIPALPAILGAFGVAC